MDTAKIEEKGLEIYYDTKWVGEPGVDRKEVTLNDKIRCVHLPLTPEEWCQLCMRDGESYIGGCCGQTGYIQDHFNSIFRDSGTVDTRNLLELAETASNHEGFELFSEVLPQTEFDKEIRDWDKHDPITKIGLCFQAVRDKLHIPLSDIPRRGVDLEDSKDIFWTLERSFRYFTYQDFFTKDDSPTGQEHGNQELLLARMFPAYAKLSAAMAEKAKPFEGFGIFSKDSDEILKNGYGLCVYYTQADAERLVAQWTKSNSDKDDNVVTNQNFVIKPIKVSMQDGLQIGNPE